MNDMIESYQKELTRIETRIAELRGTLKGDLRSIERGDIQRRLLFLEESRCNLIYGIKNMRR